MWGVICFTGCSGFCDNHAAHQKITACCVLLTRQSGSLPQGQEAISSDFSHQKNMVQSKDVRKTVSESSNLSAVAVQLNQIADHSSYLTKMQMCAVMNPFQSLLGCL